MYLVRQLAPVYRVFDRHVANSCDATCHMDRTHKCTSPAIGRVRQHDALGIWDVGRVVRRNSNDCRSHGQIGQFVAEEPGHLYLQPWVDCFASKDRGRRISNHPQHLVIGGQRWAANGFQ
jgi:hypothetical protein